MTVGAVRTGDVVEVDKRGTTFFAKATGPAVDGELPIRPLERWATWRTATSREVIGHWRATTGTRRRLGLAE